MTTIKVKVTLPRGLTIGGLFYSNGSEIAVEESVYLNNKTMFEKVVETSQTKVAGSYRDKKSKSPKSSK